MLKIVSNFLQVTLLVPERDDEEVHQEESQVRYGLDLDDVKNYYEAENRYKNYYGPVTVLERHSSETIAIGMSFDDFDSTMYEYKITIARMAILARLN